MTEAEFSGQHGPDAADAHERARARVDRLMDAIDLVKANRRDEARGILRDLIRENGDFEDAWLWMSVAVDSADQAAVCLDNVLRVNPANYAAAGALYRLRIPELHMQRRRTRLRSVREIATLVFWVAVLLTLCGGWSTLFLPLGAAGG
jgi:hypothetical protein